MKKIVFVDISMKEKVESVSYKNTGNACCSYKEPVVYPINAVLSEKIKKNEEIKIVLIQTKGNKSLVEKNTKIFQTELEAINASIGAKIEYSFIETNYEELKSNNENRLKLMLSQIEENSELYADITFGPRTVPMLVLCAFSFAEKVYNSDIKKIIYGKVDWKDGKPKNPELYDVTSLYYLNSFTYSLTSVSRQKAFKSIETFFSL